MARRPLSLQSCLLAACGLLFDETENSELGLVNHSISSASSLQQLKVHKEGKLLN
jgi:hypothetical protein